MVHFKRKDGTVFSKGNPSDKQIKAYGASGCVVCDAEGKVLERGKLNIKLKSKKK
jgi:hypothetical protein